MTFQLALALLLVAGAVVYLAAQVVRAFRRRGRGPSGCGPGCDDAAPRKTPPRPLKRL